VAILDIALGLVYYITWYILAAYKVVTARVVQFSTMESMRLLSDQTHFVHTFYSLY
jgi:hypothetical protein